MAPAAILSLGGSLWAQSDDEAPTKPPVASSAPGIIDTNVHLFDWPFRRLKYAATSALVAKLRKHRIEQAWAGSFEALLQKDLSGVNARLAEACRARGDGLLVPFGSVNPVWPDWQEDLRRCHETHKMPGIRLYPSYHNYRLDDPRFAELLAAAAERGLAVQIALEMEDDRIHHPIVHTPDADASPLIDALKQAPRAKVQLINCSAAMRGAGFAALVQETSVLFDISHLEANGAVGRLIEGRHWSIKGQVPVERLLFGSHAPYFPCEAALLRLFESPLSLDQMQSIMHVNARRLLSAASAA
jgi:predicted TIM-barrel fold metal-dependent hydrolase